MKITKNLISSVTAILALCVLAGNAAAEQSKDIGDAVVYYNAVTTDFFDPNIAKIYGIKRSKNRALLTVTVLEKRMGVATKTIKADVEATAINLSNQITDLAIREIADGDAIYYISEFPVSNKETFDFTVNVKPKGGKSHIVKFRQTFFTH